MSSVFQDATKVALGAIHKVRHAILDHF